VPSDCFTLHKKCLVTLEYSFHLLISCQWNQTWDSLHNFQCVFLITMPWCIDLLAKLIVPLLVTTFPAFCVTGRCITVFTAARHQFLSWPVSTRAVGCPTDNMAVAVLYRLLFQEDYTDRHERRWVTRRERERERARTASDWVAHESMWLKMRRTVQNSIAFVCAGHFSCV
jgi:hypothetical protein